MPPKMYVSATTVRASMGATEHIHVINESLFNAIKTAKKNLIKVVGIEVSGQNYYYESDLTGPVMLIIGGEDRSLSDEITKQCDLVVKIPLKGRVNSLNMSVAASIVIYDKIRQDSLVPS
jgi:23S rRNA (guanosine2251-2'-O)-methyltransferase